MGRSIARVLIVAVVVAAAFCGSNRPSAAYTPEQCASLQFADYYKNAVTNVQKMAAVENLTSRNAFEDWKRAHGDGNIIGIGGAGFDYDTLTRTQQYLESYGFITNEFAYNLAIESQTLDPNSSNDVLKCLDTDPAGPHLDIIPQKGSLEGLHYTEIPVRLVYKPGEGRVDAYATIDYNDQSPYIVSAAGVHNDLLHPFAKCHCIHMVGGDDVTITLRPKPQSLKGAAHAVGQHRTYAVTVNVRGTGGHGNVSNTSSQVVFDLPPDPPGFDGVMPRYIEMLAPSGMTGCADIPPYGGDCDSPGKGVRLHDVTLSEDKQLVNFPQGCASGDASSTYFVPYSKGALKFLPLGVSLFNVHPGLPKDARGVADIKAGGATLEGFNLEVRTTDRTCINSLTGFNYKLVMY